MIGSAFIIRNASDYDDMYSVSKEESAEQLGYADFIYRTIYDYISDRLNQGA